VAEEREEFDKRGKRVGRGVESSRRLLKLLLGVDGPACCCCCCCCWPDSLELIGIRAVAAGGHDERLESHERRRRVACPVGWLAG
jgi:hypothetical protein